MEFEARVEDAQRGGHFVEVPEEVASGIGARHMMRVKGTFAGVADRSNVAKMGGRLILGVHKATLEAAGKDAGKSVVITFALMGPR